MHRDPANRIETPDGRAIPASEALRRAALSRSTQRGIGIARRRLAYRNTLWWLWQSLKWGTVPAVLSATLVALLMSWRANDSSSTEQAPTRINPGLELQLDTQPPGPYRASPDEQPATTSSPHSNGNSHAHDR